MSNLLGSLLNAAGAMRVMERSMAVVQANVTNASTPGYAKQRHLLTALPFDLSRGLVGGVASGGVIGARSQFAEQSVWRQTHLAGAADERAAHLSRLEPVFTIDPTQGVSGAMSRFFQTASALAVTPNDGGAREQLLQQAARVASAFHYTAAGLREAMSNAAHGVQAQLNEIHAIADQIRQLNAQFKQDYRAQSDAGLDARLHKLLEDLGEKIDFTMLRAEDGSVTILAGGQTPLVIGERVYQLNSGPGGAGVQVLDSEGRDITTQLKGGRIAALLELRNQLLPGYEQSLNHLAAAFATEVNQVLASGVDLNGNPPSAALFSFDPAGGAARTIQAGGVTAAELALASPTAPGGNANALALAALEQQRLVDGATFAQVFGTLAGRLGRDIANAREEASVQTQLWAQAREIRDELSRVNLDEEAILLMQFQRAYQATAKVIQAADEMMDILMSLKR
jgi:flagellar hook-associated protein 1